MARNQTARNAVAGIIGGLAASFVMSQFQNLAAKLERSNGQSQASNSDEPATVKAASAISERFTGRELTADEKKWVGPVMHYAMGVASGSIYGVLARAAPLSTVATGAAFGAALWAVADETVVPALGLAGTPTQYPATTHLKALSAHMVYGIAADVARRAMLRFI